MCDREASGYEFYLVTLESDETIEVDDLDQFLLLTNSGFKCLTARSRKGKYGIAVRIARSETTVSVTAPTRQEMGSVFAVFDARKQDATIKRLEEIVPKHTVASREQKVRSCAISVALLQDLEKHLLERIPACTGIP